MDKKQVGRPALPEGERLEPIVITRSNAADRELWQQGASAAGKSLSVWVRDVLTRAARRALRKGKR